jgi:hypothetical protein
MNQFIQENIYIILLLFLLIILLLILLIAFFIIKLILDNKNKEQQPPPIPQLVTEKSNLPRKVEHEVIKEKFHCLNHPEIPSIASCLICEDVFCEKCVIEHEGMYFCKEHFRTYTDHKWVQITDEKTTPDNPETGQYIWDFKRIIWKQKNTPSFVLTHYKINIEADYIESFVQLNVPEPLKIVLENELKNFEKNKMN